MLMRPRCAHNRDSSVDASIRTHGRHLATACMALVLSVAGNTPLESWQCDLDRSGLCQAQDILRVIDLLNGAGNFEPWLDVHLPTCP